MESTLTRSTLCGALDESARYISNSLPEYSSDQGKTAAPASPFIRGEDLHDEAVNADTECDDPDDQGQYNGFGDHPIELDLSHRHIALRYSHTGTAPFLLRCMPWKRVRR